MTDRDDFRHPAWCVHDQFDLDCDPEDRQIWHHGVERTVQTERGTEITAQIRWLEFVHQPALDLNPDDTVPEIELGGQDGSGYGGGVHELQGGDGALLATVLADLSGQIQAAGWWAPGPVAA